MAYVAVSASPIHVRETGGPVDPGFGQGGERPDNSLPGGGWGGPVDPGFGVGLPPIISQPLPPSPGRPDNGLPTYPVRPDNSLPRPPHMWPMPPRPVDPGYDRPIPIYPSLPIYRPERPDNALPMPPASVWPPLPDEIEGPVMIFVWIPGVGYRWVCVDADARPEHPIAPPPLYPDNSLPETPEPK